MIPPPAPFAHRLARAVTLDNGCLSDCLEDDLRLLRRLGVKFAGRAAHVWRPTMSSEDHFRHAAAFAGRVHAEVDDDLVLQAAIFEAVFPQAGDIPIPAWVFEALGEPVEQRCFRFHELHSDLSSRNHQRSVWQPDGVVPDLTLPEARRWILFRAGAYLDAGYEALHLGQIHLMGARDTGFVHITNLCRQIRQLAAQRGRRRAVLLDAHTHGVVVDGQLLFDFASRPISAVPRIHDPHAEDLILQWKAGTPGGHHPGGWFAANHPTLVEIDNWGGRTFPLERWADRDDRARDSRWGRDDVTWLAWQDAPARADFLRYAHRSYTAAGPHVFFQPPIARTLGNDPLPHRPAGGAFYRANLASPACPDGWGDEDVIAELWTEPAPVPEPARTEARRVALPGPVVLLGELQRELGGNPGDTICPFSRLEPVSHENAICSRLLVLPRPGRYSFRVASGGTLMEPLGQGMSPGGQPWEIHTHAPAERVFVRFDYQHRTFEINYPDRPDA